MKPILNVGVFALALPCFHVCFKSSDPGELAESGEPVEHAELAEQTNTHTDFFRNLPILCGKSFGRQFSCSVDEDHLTVATQFCTHISDCNDSIMHINLFRDTNYWHGAWVFEHREGGHLYHDHLRDTRTEQDLDEEDTHCYGRYASNEGSATVQYFPADDITAGMVPQAATKVWMIELDLEAESFIYSLEKHNEPRFRTEFIRQ